MVSELRLRNQSQQLYVRALSTAWRNSIELHDPSLWLLREPELEEKMLRDADIAHAVQYRRHMIAGQRWAVLPRIEGSPRAPVAVSVATELLDGIKNFTQARLNLARAFFSGSRFGFIHGCTRKMKIGDGVERLWWCPTTIEDRDKRTYRIVPENDGETLAAHWEIWNIPKTIFEPETIEDAAQTIRHVYQEDQASLGHGRALREALGWWWYAKTHVFEESLQAVERFAQGILAAKVDGARDAESGLPNTELIREWRAVLEDLRARNVLVYDSADQIEHISMNASGWELLSTIREELRSTIFTLILGANLTTSANKGGSYALASIQENSTEALVQYDRETLEETLTDDLLGCVWFKNHANLVELGIAEEKPRFNVTQEKREDPKERADVASVLNQMGVELSLEDVLEQTGFRKPEPGEALVEKPEPAPDPFGGDGSLGRINPLGGQPGMFQRADFEVRHAPAGSSEGGQFLPADDAGGATLGKPLREMSKAEYHNVISASKVVERIVRDSYGAVDARAIGEKVRGEGKLYRATDVNLADLEIQDEKNVDPSRATPSKGAIVVDSSGFIIDGRHRAAAAKARGDTTIRALVPTNDTRPYEQMLEEESENMRASFEVRHAPAGSSEGGQFLPADDAGGGGSKDDKKDKPKKDKPKKDRYAPPRSDPPEDEPGANYWEDYYLRDDEPARDQTGEPKKAPILVDTPEGGAKNIKPYVEQRAEEHQHRKQRIQQDLDDGRLTPETAQALDAALERRFSEANARVATAGYNNEAETDKRHTIGDTGEWSMERRAMHNEIVANVMRGVPPSENKTFQMMGGGPAAGKSSIIREGFMSLPAAHVMSNADEFKEEIPEYRNAAAKREKAAAWNAHEESSMLGKRVMRESREAGLDVVWDGTGDHSLEKLASQVKPFRDAGYQVKADYVTVDPSEAWSRAKGRAAKSGRYVPEDVVKETHRNVSRMWGNAVKAGLFDESNLYDTNTRTPKLIASAKGTEIVVHDQEAFDRFESHGMPERTQRREEAAREKEKAIRGGRSPLSYPGGTLPKALIGPTKPLKGNPTKGPDDIDYEDYYLRDDT